MLINMLVYELVEKSVGCLVVPDRRIVMDLSKNWAVVDGLGGCREVILSFKDHIIVGVHKSEEQAVGVVFNRITEWDEDDGALAVVFHERVKDWLNSNQVQNYYNRTRTI